VTLAKSDSTVKPLLKWAGGKRHIASLVEVYFPPNWRTGAYFEPFFGGGAMFFHLLPERSHISDLNTRLIGFYKYLKSDYKTLIQGINEQAAYFNKLDEESQKQYFYDLRERFNSSDRLSFDSAVFTYCINKLCFNGLYRENSKGKFNVPFGQKKNLPTADARDFENAAIALAGTTIENLDFAEATKSAKRGDIVYFDPPYVPLNVTASFTSYQADGFSLEEQKRLSDLMSKMKEKGIFAVCSNSSSDIAREIYKEHNQYEIDAPRMVSASSSGRGVVKELVITNFS
jgi:DNA adenine methylase